MGLKTAYLYYVLPYFAGVLFALAMTYVPPQYRGYIFWGYFIALMVVMGLSSFMQRKKFYKSGVVDEIRRSSVLLRVSRDEVMKLFTEDPKATEELSRQMRMTMYMFIPSLIAFALFFTLMRLLAPHSGESSTTVFLRYLAIYETPIAISQSFNLYIRRRKRFEIINTVLEYEVHAKGIVGRGIAIPFPLKDYEVKVNYSRRFVELVPRKQSAMGMVRLRLYARSIDRLVRILESRGGIKRGSEGAPS